MRLDKLTLERRTWKTGHPLEGEIKFAGEHGTIEITLNDEQIQGVLNVVADALVAAAKETAAKLTASVIESSGARLLCDATAADSA